MTDDDIEFVQPLWENQNYIDFLLEIAEGNNVCEILMAVLLCMMSYSYIFRKAVGDATDILYDGNKMYYYKAARIDTKNTHGTGCTFSSAIAAQLSKGLSVENAVSRAKEYVTTAITHALPIGKGCGPTHHFYELYKNAWSLKMKVVYKQQLGCVAVKNLMYYVML